MDNFVSVFAIGFSAPDDDDLVAFSDCTSVREPSGQPNCGYHGVDRLYGMTVKLTFTSQKKWISAGCRVSVEEAYFTDSPPPTTNYSENVIFNDLMVVDTKQISFAFFPDEFFYQTKESNKLIIGKQHWVMLSNSEGVIDTNDYVSRRNQEFSLIFF